MNLSRISQVTSKLKIFILWLPLFVLPLLLCAQQSDTLNGKYNPYRMYDVKHYHLIVRVIPEKKSISGYNSIRFTAINDLKRIQIDLYDNFDVQGVFQRGASCKFTHSNNHILVDLNHEIKSGESDSIYVVYYGEPLISKKPPWDGGFIWTNDSNGNPWIGVACEGIGASSWWPCKDVLADEPDSMLISVLVPYGLFEVSNGKFLGAKNNFDGYNQFDWKVSYPINPYNVTLNIGDYHTIHDTFNSSAGPLSLDYYVLPYDVEIATSYFNDQVKPMLRCFEKCFGPYPFHKDGYALVQTPYWGMEHQSAVAYGNNFKLNPYGFDFIIVHESAHEWWGNSLSVADDSIMWMHESFATYAESLYLECTFGKDSALNYLLMQRNKIKNELPMLSPKTAGAAIRDDNDIYYKGAWMLHTLRSALNNDSLFFAIIYEFQQKYALRIVTTSDFTSLVKSMTHKDFDPFFHQYLEYKAIPTLVYGINGSGRKMTFQYHWKTDVADFKMPVDIFISGKKIRLHPTKDVKKITLKVGFSKDVLIDTNHFYIHTQRE